MDEGTRRLTISDPAERAALLETEAAALRQRLDELLTELDRRRRRAAGGLALARRYAVPALVTAALLSGGVYAVFRWQERRRSRYARRVRGRIQSFARLLSN